jgi:hypothetical protein
LSHGQVIWASIYFACGAIDSAKLFAEFLDRQFRAFLILKQCISPSESVDNFRRHHDSQGMLVYGSGCHMCRWIRVSSMVFVGIDVCTVLRDPAPTNALWTIVVDCLAALARRI